jgi:hypothetical protein
MIVAACCLRNFTLDLPFELDNDREHQNELNDDLDLLYEDNEELDDRAIEKGILLQRTMPRYLRKVEEKKNNFRTKHIFILRNTQFLFLKLFTISV